MTQKPRSTIRHALKPLWILLALVFLFEAWLWEHLRRLVTLLVDHIRLDALKQEVARWIERLPAAATFVVFLVPVLLLLPLKVLGLWLLARGSWLGATATLALAKMVSMGATAFIFDVTRPKLLQLAWFRWLYEQVLVWLDRAHALIDPIKAEIRTFMARQLAPMGRHLRALFWLMRRRGSGGFRRRLAWLRRRAQAA